jgi:hypothetical protein
LTIGFSVWEYMPSAGLFPQVGGLEIFQDFSCFNRQDGFCGASSSPFPRTSPAIGSLPPFPPFPRDAGLSELPLARFAEIVAAVGRSPVPVLIEATNRRESSVVNTVEEAARLLAAWPDFGFRILPDTYHLAAEGIEIRVRTGARSWRTCP